MGQALQWQDLGPRFIQKQFKKKIREAEIGETQTYFKFYDGILNLISLPIFESGKKYRIEYLLDSFESPPHKQELNVLQSGHDFATSSRFFGDNYAEAANHLFIPVSWPQPHVHLVRL